MADDRELRRLLNTKQDAVEFKGEPSISGMADGQIAITKSNNSQLAVHRKKYGKIWKSYMSHNGDQYIERNLKVNGKTISSSVGINTVIPDGGVGFAKFAMSGTTTNADGPHVQYTTSADSYPVFQQLNWGHDNISLNFDAYYDGAWKSSDAGSNFQFYKIGDKFKLMYDSATAQGSAITWNDGIVVNTAGIVMMGRNSPVATTKDPVLEVDGNVSFDGFIARAGTGGSDNGANVFNFFWDGSEADIYIDTTGIATGHTTSDYRIKENVATINDDVLDKINALRPISYTQKEFSVFKQSDKQRIGFIAHEVKAQLPDIVKGDKDEVDDDDNPIIQSIDNHGLTSYLVKAVQELSAKVTALENN